jgi:transposase InsO family protein
MQPPSLQILRGHVFRHAPVTLSKRAQVRLAWFDYYAQHGRNAARTCRYFGISRQTFYRWKRRYANTDLGTLESRSHRPRRRRRPTWSPALAAAICALRRQYPRWGKDKLVVMARQQGWRVSTSMVGRILTQAKARGVLVDPPRTGTLQVRRAAPPRPYACRKPVAYRPQRPGDLIEIDTLDLRPVPGVVLKHFTARDVISRWDVLEAHTRATSHTAAQFLATLQRRFPRPIKAIQVDGGSEFAAAFETACQTQGIHLFVLPPRSPKLNGAVERAHRTHLEEFYTVVPFALDLPTLNRQLRQWEQTYNIRRPHQALGYRTPAAVLADFPASPECH